MVVKEDYIEAMVRPSGLIAYGFGDLEVGDQMRCPLKPGESHNAAQTRVSSAVLGWKRINPERASLVFRTHRKWSFIVIERTA